MILKARKFQYLKYGVNPENSVSHRALNGSEVETETTVRDLDTIVSSDDGFCKYVDSITKKGRSSSGWVLRNVNNRDKFVMLNNTVYSLLLPIVVLMLCGQKRKLESIHRNFTHKICGILILLIHTTGRDYSLLKCTR